MYKMNIEIDSNNLIHVTWFNGECNLASTPELERIMQAIKQTQEKLANKKTQELQDSINELELFKKFKLYCKGNNLMLEKPDGTIVILG